MSTVRVAGYYWRLRIQLVIIHGYYTHTPVPIRGAMQEVEGVEVSVENVLVHFSSFEQHMQHLDVVLERLRRYNLTVKPASA